MTLSYGSVCSGIEAASVAWHPLGWTPAWFSEIEPFPSAVLAHHWPGVPNLGDMTLLPRRVEQDEVPAPDVLVGGTPCQAFSVAGRGESLSDPRGNLTLTFVELADALDRQRARNGQPPSIIVWENVPGVLSTKDNAFGCFLAGLAGEDVPLRPAGKRWSNAGLVLGPQRAIAWRILDAQHFGVAQRRRRVFVVASARDGFDPSAVLFEFEGLRRDTAPRRDAGEGAAADAGGGAAGAGSHWDDLTNPHPSLNQAARGSGGIGASNQEVFAQRGSGIVPGGCFWDGSQLTQTLDAVLHKGQTMPEKNRFPAVLQPLSFDVKGGLAPHGSPQMSDVTVSVLASAHKDPQIVLEPLPFDTTQITSPHNYSRPKPGDPVHPLAAGAHPPALAFHPTQDPISSVEVSHALGTGSSGGQSSSAVVHTVALRGRDGGATAEMGGEVATALRASTGGGDKPHVLAAFAVRRLTPRECERLQGFPDDHTLVPYRGKPAADGPRYKAIGNSMAVPCMVFIGQRIKAHLDSLYATQP